MTQIMTTTLFKCEKCHMEFTEEIRLTRHYKKALLQNQNISDKDGIETIQTHHNMGTV